MKSSRANTPNAQHAGHKRELHTRRHKRELHTPSSTAHHETTHPHPCPSALARFLSPFPAMPLAAPSFTSTPTAPFALACAPAPSTTCTCAPAHSCTPPVAAAASSSPSGSPASQAAHSSLAAAPAPPAASSSSSSHTPPCSAAADAAAAAATAAPLSPDRSLNSTCSGAFQNIPEFLLAQVRVSHKCQPQLTLATRPPLLRCPQPPRSTLRAGLPGQPSSAWPRLLPLLQLYGLAPSGPLPSLLGCRYMAPPSPPAVLLRGLPGSCRAAHAPASVPAAPGTPPAPASPPAPLLRPLGAGRCAPPASLPAALVRALLQLLLACPPLPGLLPRRPVLALRGPSMPPPPTLGLLVPAPPCPSMLRIRAAAAAAAAAAVGGPATAEVGALPRC